MIEDGGQTAATGGKSEPRGTNGGSEMKTSCIASAVAVLAAALIPINGLAAPGDLYVSSSTDILKYGQDGTRRVFASGLNSPTAMAFDGFSNLFVAEFGTSSILKIRPDGIKTVVAGAINGPSGLAFDPAGNMFVSEFVGNRILQFATGGTTRLFASGLNKPIGLAVDRAGNVFVADNGSGSIFKFTPDGVTRTIFASGLNQPYALAIDSAGNVYEADFGTGTVFKFTPTGTKSTFASGLNQPVALTFDKGGNLAESDQGSGTIQFLPFKFPLDTGVSGQLGLASEPTRHQFLNISTRALVGTGDNALIGGFIMNGNGQVDDVVLIRAIGPSLTAFGVPGALQDPTLELRGADGTLITSNDNWKTRSDGGSQQALIESTTLAPSDDRESAIYAKLPAGNYTAVVRGAGGTTGVAIVEVYNLQ